MIDREQIENWPPPDGEEVKRLKDGLRSAREAIYRQSGVTRRLLAEPREGRESNVNQR